MYIYVSFKLSFKLSTVPRFNTHSAMVVVSTVMFLRRGDILPEPTEEEASKLFENNKVRRNLESAECRTLPLGACSPKWSLTLSSCTSPQPVKSDR